MGIESGSTNRWKTARERNRLKARYEIQSRVISRVNDASLQLSVTDTAATGDGCRISCSDGLRRSPTDATTFSLDEINTILQYFQSVIHNDLSAFSVAALARHGHLLNGPLPAAIDHAMTPDACAKFDLSQGIPKNGAGSNEEALYALSVMLSTDLHWVAKTTEQPTSTVSTSAGGNNVQPQPTTLATSKFGRDYVMKRLVPYMQHLRSHSQRQLTLLEYASLLGRHGIVALLLQGGLDPTIGNETYNIEEKGISGTPAELASRRVLSLFHSLHGKGEDMRLPNGNEAPCVIPLSMWSYIVRSLIEMRMNGALAAKNPESANLHQYPTTCSVCNCKVRALLQFGPPCNHSFCEPCIWNHLVDHVPQCTDLRRNVVTCPICDEEFEGFQGQNQQKKNARNRPTEIVEEKKDWADTPSVDYLSLRDVLHGEVKEKGINATIELREQRRLLSLTKFMNLPATSKELKSKKNNKRRKERDAAHGTWEEALRPAIQMQQSREVRSDRFFRAVLSSPHLVIGYLEAGMDVNMQNSYGQTPLYVACWKGSVMVVKWLLHFGADHRISANGGGTCWSVAQKHQRADILHVLARFCVATDGNVSDAKQAIDSPLTLSWKDDYQVSILIDPSAEHPGAGACVVDNALSEVQLQWLVNLWQSLPVADECDEAIEDDTAKEKGESLNSNFASEKSSFRPSRSYFCDAEEEVQTMLEGCIEAVRMALGTQQRLGESTFTNNAPPSSLFRDIRFLHYPKPGGVLPPHVDLCRVDDVSGLRSTHTFILYLSDCEHGGGTALLKHLKRPTVIATAEPRRGRALIFPHLCPHSGLEVQSAPKLLLRGEIILDLP